MCRDQQARLPAYQPDMLCVGLRVPFNVILLWRSCEWQDTQIYGFALIHSARIIKGCLGDFNIRTDRNPGRKLMFNIRISRPDPVSPGEKVFCIGFGKTGSTSLAAALYRFGYRIGSQRQGELLVDAWASGDPRPIIDLCRTADAFQDLPFGLPGTYRQLHDAFPGARFILSIRNSSDDWYNSLVRFHKNILRIDRTPTPEDLKKHCYRHRYRGWLWKVHQLLYGIDEASLFNKEIYMKCYDRHCADVIEYFKGDNAGQLLVLNVADSDAMERLCRFLNQPCTGQKMPHLNASYSKWYGRVAEIFKTV